MHSDVHHVYALYFMYFNDTWYEKTNQQRFQLK